MANDAQRAADAAINGNPMKDRPDLALGVFNREFGMFTFGTYFTPNKDQMHHPGAYFSASIAGHKFAADIHRRSR